jgi:hypothetical protein
MGPVAYRDKEVVGVFVRFRAASNFPPMIYLVRAALCLKIYIQGAERNPHDLHT